MESEVKRFRGDCFQYLGVLYSGYYQCVLQAFRGSILRIMVYCTLVLIVLWGSVLRTDTASTVSISVISILLILRVLVICSQCERVLVVSYPSSHTWTDRDLDPNILTCRSEMFSRICILVCTRSSSSGADPFRKTCARSCRLHGSNPATWARSVQIRNLSAVKYLDPEVGVDNLVADVLNTWYSRFSQNMSRFDTGSISGSNQYCLYFKYFGCFCCGYSVRTIDY